MKYVSTVVVAALLLGCGESPPTHDGVNVGNGLTLDPLRILSAFEPVTTPKPEGERSAWVMCGAEILDACREL